MVIAYWKIGKSILEEEQKGKSKAVHGTALLKELSLQLTADFEKGYSETIFSILGSSISLSRLMKIVTQ
jgi:hypothetical protein